MDQFAQAKAEFPTVHDSNGPLSRPVLKARTFVSSITKVVSAVILMGLSLTLVYHVVHDKHSYDGLLSKYNSLIVQNEAWAGSPAMALARRDLESSNATFVYTTTTVTQATTITIKTTASPASAVQSSSMSIFESCGAVTPQTVTVTVVTGTTSDTSTWPISSAPEMSSVFTSWQGPSSLASLTVTETRIITATVFVTSSGLVSPKVETLTFTDTLTTMQTATEFSTVHGGDANSMFTSTSTNTAEGLFGSSTHQTHYPNTTSSFSPYGGTVPGLASHSLADAGARSDTGRLTTPLGTTTSQSDPVSTVVTVSEANKPGFAFAGVFTVGIVPMISLYWFI